MPDPPVYIIAEAGTAHGGDLEKAEKLIGAAARAGADCVKFQVVLAREILHPRAGTVPLPGGPVPLYETFRQLERPQAFYRELQALCKTRGVDFLASPFGEQSARWLQEMDVQAFKVASPELNHFPLLRQLNAWGKPLYLSCGVSRLADIEEALATLSVPVTLLHCITAYPAPEREYNLNLLPVYRQLFGCPVGVSDHSLHPLKVPLIAITRGASVIEKHLTLSRSDTGLDDPIALIPDEFARLCRHVRLFEQKTLSWQEKWITMKWGEEEVSAIGGSGCKKMAPSEADNYGRTNRSIHTVKALPRGHVLAPEDLAVLRTEKVLAPGLSPRYLSLLPGHVISRNLSSGEGIQWNHLLQKGRKAHGE